MKFDRKASELEVSKYEIKVAEKIEWWWVTVNETDMKNNIHIYWNKQNNNTPRGWQLLSEETCLGKYCDILVRSDFQSNSDSLQKHLLDVQNMAKDLDYDKLMSSPWRYATYQKEGPYMIIDGVHRQMAIFINHFIFNSQKFLPFDHALCGICSSEVNTKVPSDFCVE